MLYFHAVTDDDVYPLETEDESGRILCEYWSSIFQGRVKGPRQHQYENILRDVQKAPGDIRWVFDKNECDELVSTKKESARCARRIGFAGSVQRIQTSAGGWRYLCALCRE